MCVCGMSTGIFGGQATALGLLELQLWVAVSQPTWVPWGVSQA